jgi:hypothetical protein
LASSVPNLESDGAIINSDLDFGAMTTNRGICARWYGALHFAIDNGSLPNPRIAEQDDFVANIFVHLRGRYRHAFKKWRWLIDQFLKSEIGSNLTQKSTVAHSMHPVS